MTTIGGREQARTFAGMVGVVVLGLAIALGVFIQSQSRAPSPPEDVPRALAIPALYGTMGLVAIIGAAQRRPALVVAAGVLCFLGAMLSVATIAFVVPGVLLILLGSRTRALRPRHWSEAVVAAAALVLVVSASVALLAMTEGRCWQATGSRADPTYTVIQCSDPGGSVAGDQVFASGYDSAVLTTGGGLVEAALLLGALMLVVVTGRSPTRRGIRPSPDQALPR